MLPPVLLFLALATAQIDPLPTYDQTLYLRYPNTRWVEPGEDLLMADTHPLPHLSTHGLSHTATYLLLFLDLDVVYGRDSTVILHWYQPDLLTLTHNPNPNQHPLLLPTTPEDDNTYLLPTPSPLQNASYIPPRPPSHTHHRYVYLLFDQPRTYTFPACFSHIFPPTPAARAGFDAAQFVAAAGLGPPVAGNWFFVVSEDS
ncbi:PEBP-like protein, partial [Aspergillus ellipticus CBS 707.79]